MCSGVERRGKGVGGAREASWEALGLQAQIGGWESHRVRACRGFAVVQDGGSVHPFTAAGAVRSSPVTTSVTRSVVSHCAERGDDAVKGTAAVSLSRLAGPPPPRFTPFLSFSASPPPLVLSAFPFAALGHAELQPPSPLCHTSPHSTLDAEAGRALLSDQALSSLCSQLHCSAPHKASHKTTYTLRGDAAEPRKLRILLFPILTPACILPCFVHFLDVSVAGAADVQCESEDRIIECRRWRDGAEDRRKERQKEEKKSLKGPWLEVSGRGRKWSSGAVPGQKGKGSKELK